MKIYLASPFFNPEQLAVVETLEKTLRGLGHDVFSPREGTKLGDSLGNTMEERRASAKEIYRRNIDAMIWSDVCLAVVDGSDTGTMFEMGWFAGKAKPIVSYTNQLKPLNIMLQEAVKAHCVRTEDVNSLFAQSTEPFHERARNFQSFHRDMI